MQWRHSLLTTKTSWPVGLSPVWTLMWVWRLLDKLNAWSHSRHLYGFSPLWILLCWTRLFDCANRLAQTVHSNGFSPEWLRLCLVNAWLFPKHFPQSVHLYSLLWAFRCFLKQFRVANCFWHWLHECIWPLAWCCLWIFKFPFVVNRLSHTVHTYALRLSSCGCSVISLLSASIFTSTEPVSYTHLTLPTNREV